MRVATAVLVGIILGIALTFAVVGVSGGWYTYRTLPSAECREPEQFIGSSYQVVPGQPNPCHFRRPRWSFVR